MGQITVLRAIPLVCLGFIAACTAPVTDDSGSAVPGDSVGLRIVLPDGTECGFAGKGATLAYQGKRLNYTCADGSGLIGDVVITNGIEMTVEQASIAGTTITGSQPLTFTIALIELTDGTTCLNSGLGATMAFDGKRLNYTCGTTANVLIGDILQAEEVFTVEQAMLQGTTLQSSEMMEIRVLSAVAP